MSVTRGQAQVLDIARWAGQPVWGDTDRSAEAVSLGRAPRAGERYRAVHQQHYAGYRVVRNLRACVADRSTPLRLSSASGAWRAYPSPCREQRAERSGSPDRSGEPLKRGHPRQRRHRKISGSRCAVGPVQHVNEAFHREALASGRTGLRSARYRAAGPNPAGYRAARPRGVALSCS